MAEPEGVRVRIFVIRGFVRFRLGRGLRLMEIWRISGVYSSSSEEAGDSEVGEEGSGA